MTIYQLKRKNKVRCFIPRVSLSFDKWLFQHLVPPNSLTYIAIRTNKAEHSAFRCQPYHEAGSCTTHYEPIMTYKIIGVFVRWPGKKAEHSFFLDFLFLLHQRQKKRKNKCNKLYYEELSPCFVWLPFSPDKNSTVSRFPNFNCAYIE